MFSDSCFQLMVDLLESVTNYDYSDEYEKKILLILAMLNSIVKDLDSMDEDGKDKKKLKRESKLYVRKLFKKAQLKRVCDEIEIFDLD